MSIADKLSRLRTAHTAIINAIINKGVSASGHGFEDFATDINAIPQSGIVPTGTINITTNGTHNVYNYASAQVAVPAGGTYQNKTVTPTAAGFDVEPDSGYDALTKVTVNGDANLIAANVKKDITIFGVTGTHQGQGTYQTKTVTPTAAGFDVEPDRGYDAMTKVTVNGDADLVAGNIKKDVVIFGVTGTYEPSPAGSLIVCECSSNIESVDVIYGSESQIGVHMQSYVAYAIIPYSYTGSVTVRGHYTYYDPSTGTSEARTTETYVTITTIQEYDCSLLTTTTIYDAGVWAADIGEQSITHIRWSVSTSRGCSAEAEIDSTYIHFGAGNGAGTGYSTTALARLNAAISTRGYHKLRFTFDYPYNPTANGLVGYYTDGTSTGIDMESTSVVAYSKPTTVDVDIASGTTTIYIGFGVSSMAGTYAFVNFNITKIEFV